MGWNNVLPTYDVHAINIPTFGCFNTGYFLSKATFQSCQITLQYETSSSDPSISGNVSRSSVAPEVQMALNDDWTASIVPSGLCLRRIRSNFLSCRGNPANSFANGVFHCMGIKRKWGIPDGPEFTFSVSPDRELCFFGIQVAVQGNIGPRRMNIGGRDRNCRIQLQASLTVRFNLNARGWGQLIRQVGTRALSVLQRVPGAAARIIGLISGTAAIIVVGTVILTALLVYGTAYFIESARRSGIVRVNAWNYAAGYVDALIRPELSRSGYQSAIDRYTGPEAKINGYVDAIHNAMEFGYRRTRFQLLTRIGMRGVLNAESPGGARFVFVFGGGRFPESTRQNLIGALKHRILHNEVRALTVPLLIR